MTGHPERLAIVGLGLIGGSIARAVAARRAMDPDAAPSRVVAWSPSGAGPARAADEGVIDRAALDLEETLDGADLVVLAAPPLETIGLIERLGDGRARLANRAVVTDVTSTKARVAEAAGRARLRFVAGHPMGGRESTGYEASSADLFADRPWVIVPPEPPDPEAVAAVEWLAASCGARAISMSAEDHDAVAAAISHLPLVASAALVEAVALDRAGGERPDWSLARELAAGGWASMTRLARGDPRMGAGIAATNSRELAHALHRYRAVLDEWIAALDGPGEPDAAALERRLRAARDIVAGEDGSA